MAVVSAPDAEGLSAQRFFCDHAHEISTVAVHPDGVTVATGEDAVLPEQNLWSCFLSLGFGLS